MKIIPDINIKHGRDRMWTLPEAETGSAAWMPDGQEKMQATCAEDVDTLPNAELLLLLL